MARHYPGTSGTFWNAGPWNGDTTWCVSELPEAALQSAELSAQSLAGLAGVVQLPLELPAGGAGPGGLLLSLLQLPLQLLHSGLSFVHLKGAEGGRELAWVCMSGTSASPAPCTAPHGGAPPPPASSPPSASSRSGERSCWRQLALCGFTQAHRQPDSQR